jgi:hypothetical protein
VEKALISLSPEDLPELQVENVKAEKNDYKFR